MTSKKLLSFLAVTALMPAFAFAQSEVNETFDGPDGPDIGSGWNQMVGTWELFQGVARPFQEDLTLEKLLVYDPVSVDRAFVLEGDFNWTPLRNQWNGLAWNIQAADTFYILRVRGDNGNVQVIRRVDGANAAVLVNNAGAAGPLEEGVFHRLTVQGDGEGKISWSVSTGDVTLASGTVTDAEPLPPGPAGIYAGREAIEIDRFHLRTFDLAGEAPDVGIATAVEVFFPSVVGILYQIQSSADLEEWVDEGNLIEGTGQEVSVFFGTRGQERRFYRVITSAAN